MSVTISGGRNLKFDMDVDQRRHDIVWDVFTRRRLQARRGAGLSYHGLFHTSARRKLQVSNNLSTRLK